MLWGGGGWLVFGVGFVEFFRLVLSVFGLGFVGRWRLLVLFFCSSVAFVMALYFCFIVRLFCFLLLCVGLIIVFWGLYSSVGHIAFCFVFSYRSCDIIFILLMLSACGGRIVFFFHPFFIRLWRMCFFFHPFLFFCPARRDPYLIFYCSASCILGEGLTIYNLLGVATQRYFFTPFYFFVLQRSCKSFFCQLYFYNNAVSALH